MNSKKQMIPKNMLLVFSLFIILTLFTSLVMAYHTPPGYKITSCVECPPTGSQGCACIDVAGCHYSCPGGTLIPVPNQKGLQLDQALASANQNLAFTKKLREGRALSPEEADKVIEMENQLIEQYEKILAVDPDNFWANWDYADLKQRNGDHGGADKLYYNAIDTLEPKTRSEVLKNFQKSKIEKLDPESLKPKESSLFSNIRNTIDDAVENRRKTHPKADKDAEKLTLLGKLAKKAGICEDPKICNACVTGARAVGGCVVDTLVMGADR